MTMETIMNCFAQYGGIAIFVIVFLEYLNLPGFPAGVIMPLAGIWAAGGKIPFVTAFLITVAAGLYQEAVRERRQSRWRTGLPAEQFLCKV